MQTILKVFPLILLVLANTGFQEGSLVLLNTNPRPIFLRLGFDGGKLMANDKFDILYYYESGFLWHADSEKYLAVNNEGELFLSHKRASDFSLKQTPGTRSSVKYFTFKGKKKFQLCSDGRVRYKSRCRGFREVEIYFLRSRPSRE